MIKKYLIISILCITVVAYVGCAGANDNDLDMDRTGYDDNLGNNNQNDDYRIGYDDENPIGYDNMRNDNGFGYDYNDNVNYSRVGYGDYPNNMGTTRNGYNDPASPYPMNNGYGRNGLDYNNNNGNNQSARVADRIKDLPNINDCSVVLSGDTCLVGLDTDNDVSKDQLQNIKNTVQSDIKTMCPWVDDVSVTESDDLFKRIKNLSDDVNNGRTMNNVGTEIGDIVKDIVR